MWVCSACTAAYSVGAPRCPQCSSTDYREAHAPASAAAELERPADSATRPVWDAYAAAIGVDGSDLNKSELIAACDEKKGTTDGDS